MPVTGSGRACRLVRPCGAGLPRRPRLCQCHIARRVDAGGLWHGDFRQCAAARPVIYTQPVIVQRAPVYVQQPPLYLHVPPGHAKNGLGTAQDTTPAIGRFILSRYVATLTMSAAVLCNRRLCTWIKIKLERSPASMKKSMKNRPKKHGKKHDKHHGQHDHDD